MGTNIDVGSRELGFWPPFIGFCKLLFLYYKFLALLGNNNRFYPECISSGEFKKKLFELPTPSAF